MKSLKTVLEEAGIWTNIAPQTDEPPTQDPIPGGIDIALAGEIKYYSEANHIFKDRKIAISDYYKNEIKYILEKLKNIQKDTLIKKEKYPDELFNAPYNFKHVLFFWKKRISYFLKTANKIFNKYNVDQ